MKKPLRVLVIEDSEFDAKMLINLVRHGGYEVTWRRVESAEAMQEALGSQEWDLVFSDHEMPHFSAPEALRLLQETGRDLPFLIVSGGIGEAVAVAAMKAGAHDYLIKGQLGRLVPAVERELREAANRRARRQAELSLRESEMRYRLLWENSPDAVVLMDEAGAIRFVNPAVSQVFGYAPEELSGKSFMVLQPADLPVDVPHGICCAWHPDSGVSKSQMIETLGLDRTGRLIHIEIGFSNMRMEDRDWTVAFIRDITARKEAEQALRENEEQFRVAREIQQHLFPKAAPNIPGYDIAGVSYSAEATGGDYFDYMPMNNDGLGIVVADVVGHGLGPALLMAETRAYLRIVALNREKTGDVLTRANRVIAEDVGSERFVTLLLARLDAAVRTLYYTNAGHPAGYLLGSNGEVKVALKRTGVPLGIRPDTVYADSPCIHLEPGDLLILVTDGCEETMSPDNDVFGDHRILEAVRTSAHLPAAQILAALFERVRAFAQGGPQLDDLTAVVLKVLP